MLQFAGSSHTPPAVLIQVIVAVAAVTEVFEAVTEVFEEELMVESAS